MVKAGVLPVTDDTIRMLTKSSPDRKRHFILLVCWGGPSHNGSEKSS